MKNISFILSLSFLLATVAIGCSENNNNTPDTSNHSSNITHQDPDNPDILDNPDNPDNPDIPNIPDNPDNPDAPDDPPDNPPEPQCQSIAYKILSNTQHEYIDELSNSEYKFINSKDEWDAFTETELFTEGVAQKDALKGQVNQINFENTMLIYMRARSGSGSMKFVIDKACDHEITAATVWCADDGGNAEEYLNTMILSAPKDTYTITISRSHEVTCD